MGNGPRSIVYLTPCQWRFHFCTVLRFQYMWRKTRKNGIKVFAMCVFQKVRQKNQEMKVLMDQMRNLLWDVNAMLTLRKWQFFSFLGWGVFVENESHTEDDKEQVKRGMWYSKPEATHNSSTGTPLLGLCQLKSCCHFLWVMWGLSCLWLWAIDENGSNALLNPSLCLRRRLLSASLSSPLC